MHLLGKIQALADAIPYLVGGSADLAIFEQHLRKPIRYCKDHFEGRNFHFGVRELGMAAIMNGISCMEDSAYLVALSCIC